VIHIFAKLQCRRSKELSKYKYTILISISKERNARLKTIICALYAGPLVTDVRKVWRYQRGNQKL